MAKFFGSAVKTGKLGGSVFSIRNGVVIERQYQPYVANPSTPAQVQARAKLKLMSQLSEVMAPIIAIPKEGIVSSRNLFVKKNYPSATYANNRADINLTGLDVTGGILAIPAVTGSVASSTVSMRMAQALEGFDRVVYGIFIRLDDGSLRYVNAVTALAGADNQYAATYNTESNLPTLVVAYAIRFNTEKARVVFSNIDVSSATYIANIIASARVSQTDVSLSETRAAILTSSQG